MSKEQKKKAAGSGIPEVDTEAPTFAVGDMVEHLDDPRARGRVLKIDGGRVTIEGTANHLPADKLRTC